MNLLSKYNKIKLIFQLLLGKGTENRPLFPAVPNLNLTKNLNYNKINRELLF